ncbi:nucleotidyltransferase family protein [Polaribacter sp. BAL334]|uniref:nucleotidyltransferase family protein n=1 Tax=Polaribacter sp. BAL334 TaxID=1708178 RepID=UPI0018D24836|nr:nucleotidyltransferase family protein [Polaribacter sp. BAL334]MBG7611731.1 nucleotidyltransferase family protein [Polaribacter sp. BAL334]
MTYKDTLFFVGQCLTINHEEKNKVAIESQLAAGTVDWEAVVKLSTAHYVFPALYLNLLRADFLHYLPEELVAYMEHITDLNRERNLQIIAQAKEINALLLANNITPIFLKGTGNLLEGLYEDIAERMVGDIDFIVSKEDYLKTINIIIDFGFEVVDKDSFQYPIFRHYPRLYNNKFIAAIEIHKELVKEKYKNEFNYEIIKKGIQLFNDVNIISYENQLKLTIISSQINDNGFAFKSISLRNAYDVFLLSKKTDPKRATNVFNKLKEPLNCFLATCYFTMGNIACLEYNESTKTKSYINLFYLLISNDDLRNEINKKTSKKILKKELIELSLKFFTNKQYRKWILKRVTDKKWRQQIYLRLGLIKA